MSEGNVSLKTGGVAISTVALGALGATEYCIATVVTDISGSVSGYERSIEKVLMDSVEGLRASPRAENLLLRHVKFSTTVRENHGFELITGIDTKRYENSLNAEDATALYQATLHSLEGIEIQAEDLTRNNFLCNAILIIVTDGADNVKGASPQQIKKKIEEIRRKEILESLVVILVGINTDSCEQILKDFHQNAGITHFVPFADYSPKTMRKLTGIITSSISSSSQALGTGGPSKALAQGQNIVQSLNI